MCVWTNIWRPFGTSTSMSVNPSVCSCICTLIHTSIPLASYILCIWVLLYVGMSIHTFLGHLCVCQLSVHPFLHPLQYISHAYVHKGISNMHMVIKFWMQCLWWAALNPYGVLNITVHCTYFLLIHRQFH